MTPSQRRTNTLKALFLLLAFVVGIIVAPRAIEPPTESQGGPKVTAQTATLTRLQSRGAALRAYRSCIDSVLITQTRLAQLSGVPQPVISRIERGLDSATIAQENALAGPLLAIYQRRFHSETESWLMGLLQRVRP